MNRSRSLLQFKITLVDIDPPIWRRILVPATYTFWDLHVAIQDSMGWLDYHNHSFQFPDDPEHGDYIGIPVADFEDVEVSASWDIKVADHLNTTGQHMRYLYDFCDSWMHELVLEDIVTRVKGVKYPQCIGGERACPPEDCGGARGYEYLVDMMTNGPGEDDGMEEYEAYTTWLKGDITRYPPFRPEVFDIGKVRFDSPKRRWRGAFGVEADYDAGLLPPEALPSYPDDDSALDHIDTFGPTLSDLFLFGFLRAMELGKLGEAELRIVLENSALDTESANEVLSILTGTGTGDTSRKSLSRTPETELPIPAIYKLKVTLKGSKPPIWRRILIPSTTELPVLHSILQTVMGWDGGHLHQFVDGSYRYRDVDPSVDFDFEAFPETGTTIAGLLLKPKEHILYEYDFGDGWIHKIVLEDILPPQNPDGTPAEGTIPVCIGGRHCCPPEDVGGIWGYYEYLQAISDPTHPEHAIMLEWGGHDFDPDDFSPDYVNALLGVRFRQT